MKNTLFTFIFLTAYHLLPAQCNPDKLPPLLVPKGNIQVSLGGPKCIAAVKPEQFLTTVSDNCSPLTYIKLGVRRVNTGWGFPMPNRPLQLTAVDMTGPVIVEVWAKDSSGNTTSVYSSVTVTNPAGCVFNLFPDTMCVVPNEPNSGVEDLTWQIESKDVTPPILEYVIDDCITVNAGFMGDTLFKNLYKIYPYKDNDPLNGVSTFDLVLIWKHILEYGLLDNPYRIIAADVDRSGNITMNDLVELRKLILGIYTELPNNPSWRFVPADYEFPYPNNPFYGSLPEFVEVYKGRQTPLPDFVPIKVGDVNYNAISNSLLGGGSDRAPAVLRIQDAVFHPGETYSIPVGWDGTPTPAGFQFAFAFDPARLEIAGLQAGCLPDLTEENYFQPEPGLLTVSWTNPKPAAINPETPAFYLNVRALQETTLQQALALQSERLKPEAYSTTGGPAPLALQILPLPLPAATSVGAAFPNPGNGDVQIPIDLTHDIAIQMELATPEGRVLSRVQHIVAAGRHQLTLKQDLFNGYSGVILYRIRIDGLLYQGKLLRL